MITVIYKADVSGRRWCREAVIKGKKGRKSSNNQKQDTREGRVTFRKLWIQRKEYVIEKN